MDFRHSDNPNPFSKRADKEPTALDYLINLKQENEMLHTENALKLTQILDLEQLLYNVRRKNKTNTDGSPCWCKYPLGLNHSLDCIKARRATEPFWKK